MLRAVIEIHPTMTSRKVFSFIDDPNLYGTVEDLERELKSYREIPETVMFRDEMIENIERVIAEKKAKEPIALVATKTRAALKQGRGRRPNADSKK